MPQVRKYFRKAVSEPNFTHLVIAEIIFYHKERLALNCTEQDFGGNNKNTPFGAMESIFGLALMQTF